ncbi:hypothetical protein ACSSS7_002677 [Eimeria intestinalis]
MNRLTLTATQGPVDTESDNHLPVSSDKSNGGGEGEGYAGKEPGPSSPDYSELCRELGSWSPSNSFPGEPRSSPTSVQAYFTSLDQSVGQSPGETSLPAAAPALEQPRSAASNTGEKRPLDEGNSDGETAPGPSWKVAKTSAPSVARQVSQPHLPAAALSSALPSSSDLASTSSGTAAGAGPPQVPASGPDSQHPFVRLPTLEPGVSTRQFLVREMRDVATCSRSTIHVLLRIRELFRKQSLNEIQAQDLLIAAEALAKHAYHWMQSDVGSFNPSNAADRLGRRFLIIYYLFCASQILGQDWPRQPWWGELMSRIPHQFSWDTEKIPFASPFNGNLAEDLSSAIAQTKSGVPPPPAVIVDLLRRLLCLRESPANFRKKQWDPWREDLTRAPQ